MGINFITVGSEMGFIMNGAKATRENAHNVFSAMRFDGMASEGKSTAK